MIWCFELSPQSSVLCTLGVNHDHEQRLRQGTARRHGLRVSSLDRPGTVRVFGDDAIDGGAGTARFDWDALDAWFEEDEQVFVHPRDPYVRVDALRSTRRVRTIRLPLCSCLPCVPVTYQPPQRRSNGVV